MSDELQVTQSNSGTYGTVGALAGGTGAGLGAYFLTKPKYGSYEDIIAEAQDSFDKKLEKAEGEDKNFLTAAKEMREKQVSAEAEYNNMFEEFKKANGNTKVETEEYKKLVQAETDAQTALNTKKQELINAKIEKLKAGSNPESVRLEDAVNKKVRQIADQTKYLEKLQAQNAEKAKIDVVTARIKALEKEADDLSAKIAEKLDYGKLKGEALEAKKEEVTKAYRQAIQDRVNQRMTAFDAPIVSKDVKLLKRFTKNQTDLANQRTAIEKSLKELGEHTGKDITGIYNSAHGNLLKQQLSSSKLAEGIQLDRLNKLLDAYKKVSEGGANSFSWSTFFESLKKLGTGQPLGNNATAQDIQAQLEKYLKDNKTLNENQIAAVKKLINGEINEQTINDAIKVVTERKSGIEKVAEALTKQQTELNKLLEESETIKIDMQKRNVYVRNGVLIDKKTGKPVKPANAPAAPQAKVEIPKGVTVPKNAQVEIGSKTVANLTEEELKTQAEALVKPETYAQQTNALEAAKAARETAYGKLENGAERTAEELTEAFHKAKNIESKTKFIEDKVETASRDFREKFAEQLKRRYGFAEHTNWKIAGAAAVGAALIGGLAYLLSPKNNG